MKKTLYLLIALITYTTGFLIAELPQLDFSQFGGGDFLLPPPTEEEIAEAMKFLESLTPEEKKELEEIGRQLEEYAKEQGKQGAMAPMQPFEPQPIQKKTAPVTEKKEKDKTFDDKNKVELEKAFAKILTQLVEVVHAIRKKAATEEEITQKISPLDKDLNTFLYYLEVINHERVIKHMLDTEFEPLRTKIQNLSEKLIELNNTFTIPTQVSLEKQGTKERKQYKSDLKKAFSVFDAIYTAIKKAFTEDSLITELEKVIKKYEPEALKIKKEEEEKAQKAKDFTKRIDLTPTNTGRSHSVQPPYSYDYYASMTGTDSNLLKGALPKQPELKNQILANNDKVKTIGTPSDKSKKEAKKAISKEAQTIPELEKIIPHYLKGVEEFLAPKFERVISFVDNYKKESSEGDLTSTLRELNFRLDKAKKEIGKWTALLDKENDFQKFNISKQKMKDLLAVNDNFPALKNLHHRTKKTSNLKDNIKHFHSMMNFIEDKLSC